MIYLLLSLLVFAQTPEDTEIAEPTEAGESAQLEQLNSTVVEELSGSSTLEVDRLLKPFEYDPQNKRDPFLRPEGDMPLYGQPVHGPFLELQEIPLSNFKLRGVLIYPQNPKALFELRVENQTKMIKLGLKDYIGENFGYIAAIRPDKVIIVQTKEQNGEKFTTTRTLSIEK